MRKSVLTWIAIVTALLSGMITLKPAYAPATTVTVDPVMSTGNIGDIISVDINLADVFNMYGYEFKLYFDTNVLSVVDMAPHLGSTNDPGFFFSLPSPPGYKMWQWVVEEDLGDGTGYVWLIITRPLGTTEGLSGSGKLATIQFSVDMTGSGYLDLRDFNMGDPQSVPIIASIFDGYFSNVVPTTFEANLVGKSAWPEHHHFVAEKDAISDDGLQTLYSKVRNTGTVVTRVKVVFTIYDEYGLILDTPETDTVELAAGSTTYLSVDWGGFTIPMKYSGVEAQAWYDSVGNGVIQTAATKIKPFSFAVV